MKREKYRLVRLQSLLCTYISMCVGLGKKHGGHSFVIQDNVLFRFLVFKKLVFLKRLGSPDTTTCLFVFGLKLPEWENGRTEQK